MAKIISFLIYVKLLLFRRNFIGPDSNNYYDFLFKYSSRWLFLVTIISFFFIFLLISLIVSDFTYNIDDTMKVLNIKIVLYLLILIPSITVLLYRLFLHRKKLDFRRFRLFNSLISIFLSTAAIFYILFVIYENSMTMNIVQLIEIYNSTFVVTCFYIIIWVLTQVSLIKFILLILHNFTILIFSSFFINIPNMSLMRLFLSLLAVSILLIYYSGYREKQCLDSYLFNQKNEKIQEDWKNIIDYFPNGLVLISLKKNVLFRNKTLIELLLFSRFSLLKSNNCNLFH